MRNVYLAQVNQLYGRNAFFPYSVGLLWSYAQKDELVRSNYRLAEFLFLREAPDLVVRRMDKPDIVGISCYIWNWEYNLVLARAVKAAFPDCLIVLGGPQVPNRSPQWLADHPYVDILVHQEGQGAFQEILRQRLVEAPDYTQIGGLSVQGGPGDTVQTGRGSRMVDLDSIPSPYLTGLFDTLAKLPYDFNASQETHRGCPYSCTFCDWGSAVFTKVRSFGDDRIVDEYEWFARNKIELLYNCDANYGMLKRDIAITEDLVRVKQQSGYPRKFRAAYAKKSNANVFRIAELLSREGMNKGVTLSMQSMDSDTLDAVKRGNIKMEDFSENIRKYKASNIATYTEVILGLPGESWASFRRGIDQILDARQHDSINIYPCMLLPNSEMSDEAYVQRHGIRAVRTQMLWLHAKPNENDTKEYYDLVIETATMPRADWRKSYKLAWAVQALHCLPALQAAAIVVSRLAGIPISEFYLALLERAQERPETILGQQSRWADAKIDEMLDARSTDIILPEFGDIVWPLEEASFLSILKQRETFYEEIAGELLDLTKDRGWNLSSDLIEEILAYQKATVAHPDDSGDLDLSFRHNIDEIVNAEHAGEAVALRQEDCRVVIARQSGYAGDWVAFAREAVWYGRKGGCLRNPTARKDPAGGARMPRSTALSVGA